MTRLTAVIPATLLFLLLLAPAAMADAQEPISGEGSYGPADDKVVTGAGLIVIAFFPLFILCMSLLQSHLEKRKEARKEAAKRLHGASGGTWEAGW